MSEDLPQYFRYDQHPDAWPARPWWRRVPSVPGVLRAPEFRRSDGAVVSISSVPLTQEEYGNWIIDRGMCPTRPEPPVSDQLLAYDREHPMPAPAPKCGQVWVWPPEGGVDRMVTDVVRRSGAAKMDGDWWTEWPPIGAVLVAGPGAPWAPREGHD